MNTLFLHMPKCAGASMKKILMEELDITFDNDSFFRFPEEKRTKLILNSLKSPKKISGNSFLYGHFYPVKYLGNISNNKTSFRLITFLRDPLERLASHYSFWQKNKKIYNLNGHYIMRKMIRDNWSFKEFCLSQEMKNFYSQYLIYIPSSNFDFVGIHERIDEDWEKLCDFLDIKYKKLPKINISPNSPIKELSDADKKQIQDHHSEDISLYSKFKKLN